MENDLEQLKWLRLGYLINAGSIFLFSLFPFIHLSLGIMMVTGNLDEGQNPPPPFFGWIFIIIAAVFITGGMALAVSNFLTAKYLKEQTHHTFCFVISIINCTFAPLGIILGVFSIIVLMRESVKQLFNTTIQPISVNPPDWR